jgi:hypothetical protein
MHLIGALDDEEIVEVLAMYPTVVELEEVATWLQVEGDMLVRRGHALSPRIASMLDIVGRDDESEL